MTKEFSQYVNEIHQKLWKKSDDGETDLNQIELTIRMTAGDTVVDKYFEALTDLGKIEQVPDTEKWIVEKPEQKSIEITDSERVTTHTKIPKEVKEAGNLYGVNFSNLLTEAVIEEVSNKKDFISNNLKEELSEKETEYVFELMKKNAVEKKGNKRTRAKRDRVRRKLYKKILDEKPDSDHIEKLRQKSFDLQETL